PLPLGEGGAKRRVRVEITTPYAQLKPCFTSGSERIRLPVAAKIALQIAGGTGGSAGSPRPVGGLLVFRKCTSISAGAFAMRASGYWWKLLFMARPLSNVISVPIT